MAARHEVSQGRSPRYPGYPLEAAIGYARRLYDGAHRSTIDTLTAYRVMGFAGKSGGSAIALGSTRQFGLVEGTKGGVRISGLCLAVLEPKDAEERRDALHSAANNPDIFAAIMEEFEGEPPRSDEPIRSFLIRSKSFSKSGADGCILSFRATFSYLEGLDDSQPQEADQPLSVPFRKVEESRSPSEGLERSSGTARVPTHEVMRMPLSKQCVAELAFSGEVTEEALVRLIRHIELMKEVWAEK